MRGKYEMTMMTMQEKHLQISTKLQHTEKVPRIFATNRIPQIWKMKNLKTGPQS